MSKSRALHATSARFANNICWNTDIGRRSPKQAAYRPLASAPLGRCPYSNFYIFEECSGRAAFSSIAAFGRNSTNSTLANNAHERAHINNSNACNMWMSWVWSQDVNLKIRVGNPMSSQHAWVQGQHVNKQKQVKDICLELQT